MTSFYFAVIVLKNYIFSITFLLSLNDFVEISFTIFLKIVLFIPNNKQSDLAIIDADLGQL